MQSTVYNFSISKYYGKNIEREYIWFWVLFYGFCPVGYSILYCKLVNH